MKHQLNALLLAAALGVSAATASHAAAVNVIVNNRLVAFSGAQAQQIGGSVVVPLRGVFEQLGANVDYNAATRAIVASKGNRLIQLRFGDTMAYVDGVAQPLAQSPLVQNGTTLVPLRFVAQALGAKVDWIQATSTVNIASSGGTTTPPPPPPTPTAQTLSGTVSASYLNASPAQVLIRSAGKDVTVPLEAGTIILSQRGKDAAVQVTQSGIYTGDLVEVTRTDSGTARNIRVRYDELRGNIKSNITQADGSHTLTLTDGRSVQTPRWARASAGGRINMSDVHVGDTVVIRTNPARTLGYVVQVR